MAHFPIRRRAGVFRVLLLSALVPWGAAGAQPGRLGSYAGTIEVSGTQHGPEVAYRARVKVSMPVSQREDSRIVAEFLAGEAPNASVLVSQWDSFHREKSADSGGQFNTETCKLAQPVEIPMSATGVLSVDLEKKRHAFSLVLLSMRDVAFDCVHSRSGASKKKHGIALTLGTGVPGMQDASPVPFGDPGQLAAKYTLVPAGGLEREYGPIVQAWDLKRIP